MVLILCGRPHNRVKGSDFPEKVSAAELGQGKNRIGMYHTEYQHNVHLIIVICLIDDSTLVSDNFGERMHLNQGLR